MCVTNTKREGKQKQEERHMRRRHAINREKNNTIVAAPAHPSLTHPNVLCLRQWFQRYV